MDHAVVATMIGGGLEGLRSLAAVAGRKSTPVPRRRRSGRPPGNRLAMAHAVVATMIGGLEGCGPSQPLPAVNQHHCTAPTERTPRESAGNGPSARGNDDRWRP